MKLIHRYLIGSFFRVFALATASFLAIFLLVTIFESLRTILKFGASFGDANVPMSIGIPSITIGGGGRGRDAHTPRESFDATDSWQGTQMVALLAVALSR